MNKLREHKDYIIGVTIIVLIGTSTLVLVYGPRTTDLPVVVDIILTTVTVTIPCLLVGGIILGISGAFTKNFTFNRFIKISTVISVLWTLTTIISTIKFLI